MNRARKVNKGLPRRVYLKDGAYRFKPIEKMKDPRDGKLKSWITLCPIGDGEAAMLSALSKLLGDQTITTESMVYVCREFSATKLSKFSKEVQSQYKQFLSVIANDFEDFTVQQVTTKNCADFLRLNFKDKPNTAKKYAGLMRKLFKYTISELGLRQDNPIEQLDLGDYETTRREILPTHEQIKAIREAGLYGKDGKRTQSGPMFQCLIDMAYLCWQRGMDIRELKETQVDETNGFIRFAPSKTLKTSGKLVDIAITPAIQDVLQRAKSNKRAYEILSPYVFPTRKGTPYTRSGLFSMWDRARERAKIADEIIFKDLRALGATDAARKGTKIEDIQTRLVHTSTKTSQIYIKEAIPVESNLETKLPWE
jgi:integrase